MTGAVVLGITGAGAVGAGVGGGGVFGAGGGGGGGLGLLSDSSKASTVFSVSLTTWRAKPDWMAHNSKPCKTNTPTMPIT
jgi:hypothetical protein